MSAVDVPRVSSKVLAVTRALMKRKLLSGSLLSVILLAIWQKFKQMSKKMINFPKEKYPVEDFIAWADPKKKDFIHSAMLLRTFHRGDSIFYAFRQLLASYVSRGNVDLALRIMPEMRDTPLFRYVRPEVSDATLEKLRKEAANQHAANGEKVRLFFTGVTGFVGHEFLYQAATDNCFEEIICLIWDREMAGRTSEEFREIFLGRLPIAREHYSKFTFVSGDVSKDKFGMAPESYEHVARNVSHIVHCAASVSFEDPYEKAFYSNVLGVRHACQFAWGIQKHPGNKFVCLVLTETCYIHGRRYGDCPEDGLEFPNDFYNNYYEVTKAFGSIEGERNLVQGLRLTQVCPAIVIGRSHDGVNHGDTKVCNAPINTFGRSYGEVQKAATNPKMTSVQRFKVNLLDAVVRRFPSDPQARLNLVCVDRVCEALRAALARPQAVGHRFQIGSHPDEQITPAEISVLVRNEIGTQVKNVNPVIYRYIRAPIIEGFLAYANLGAILDKFRSQVLLFSRYAEWGQPRHMVGKDCEVLGLGPRPNVAKNLTMVLRHNEFAQEFAKVRADRIFHRERVWEQFLDMLRKETGIQDLADMPAAEFRKRTKLYHELLGSQPEKICEPLIPKAPKAKL